MNILHITIILICSALLISSCTRQAEIVAKKDTDTKEAITADIIVEDKNENASLSLKSAIEEQKKQDKKNIAEKDSTLSIAHEKYTAILTKCMTALLIEKNSCVEILWKYNIILTNYAKQISTSNENTIAQYTELIRTNIKLSWYTVNSQQIREFWLTEWLWELTGIITTLNGRIFSDGELTPEYISDTNAAWTTPDMMNSEEFYKSTYDMQLSSEWQCDLILNEISKIHCQENKKE